jgi:hypothetical protein
MLRVFWCGLLLSACVATEDDLHVSSAEQHGVNMQGVNMQGVNMQGVNMQGVNMQGVNMQGFAFGGMKLAHVDLDDARVERGELVAERNGVTLRGVALAGTRLYGVGTAPDGSSVITDYRISAVVAEPSKYDPTSSGHTYLYTLEQGLIDGSWVPACSPDSDGRRAAIPVASTFDTTGARTETGGVFTFACTTGVIAKCYRWGYRPWLTGYGGADFSDLHWTCTRMARADYCGDGTSGTRDGTAINVWDRLPAPGPIQKHGLLPPLGMAFEAGWDTGGAVCLSHARWLLDLSDGLQIAQLCPDRLVPPGLLGETVCNTVAGVLAQNPNAQLFNESYLNLDLGL